VGAAPARLTPALRNEYNSNGPSDPGPSRRMRTLIRHGTVVTAGRTVRADVLVDGEHVAAVAPSIEVPADRVIDATARYVLPGGVDAHTHMDLPMGSTVTADDFLTGTRAAAFGGTTTIVDFAIQGTGEGLRPGLERWQGKARIAAVDYGFHMIVKSLDDSVLQEMDELVDDGVTSFKLFMAYPGVYMLDDDAILTAMRRAAGNGALILLHAETGPRIEALRRRLIAEGKTEPRYHGQSRPPSMEAHAVRRTFELAEAAGAAAYVVHLSSRDGLEEVRAARARGVAAFAETCPQYLFLSEEDMARPGFEGAKFVCSPPLRPKDHQDELWNGLADGDLQVVATDHAPFNFVGQKDQGVDDFTRIPNGLPTVEDRFTLLFQGVHQGRIGLERFVDLVATAPAKLFGLYPRKGTIEPGSDADLVVFDPARERVLSVATHHMNVDYSCFEGLTVRGLPEVVLQRGEILVENGAFLSAPGRGRFLRRARFQPP